MKFLEVCLLAVSEFGGISGLCASLEAVRMSLVLDFDLSSVWKQRSASAKRLYKVVQEPYQL